MKTTRALPERNRPRLSCDGVIEVGRHLCWTSAEAWEMNQLEVCSLCQAKNFDLFFHIITQGDRRIKIRTLNRYRLP